MADLTVDPVQMKMAASACLTISQEVQAKIAQIQRALDGAGTWQGATKRASVEQFAQQAPVLTRLGGALEKGSTTLQNAGYGFLDHDQTGAQGVGNAGAAAGGPGASGAGSALSGSPLNA